MVEYWWILKTQEVERASAAGNSRALFKPFRSIGRIKSGVSGTMCEKDGTVIHSFNCLLGRWAELFKEQLSWSPTRPLEEATGPEWNNDTNPPSVTGIQLEISRATRVRMVCNRSPQRKWRSPGKQDVERKQITSRMELLVRHPSLQEGSKERMRKSAWHQPGIRRSLAKNSESPYCE
ncbi:ATP-binding cassette transporter [Clonorchis sinensis]|uniref:ATP-binding cassette transporter n=1 Tax=Clonorchis sinensis TaxID=79923 RepID=H2KSP2_CLOSI|nr:ATP-binding cassette transporter [Clonorchis sinensis]